MVILLLFIVWVIAELFVVIQVAQAIGVLLTVILLIAGWPLGSWLLRSEGRAAWRRLTEAVAAGRPPAKEAINGGLALVGGVLLMVPGFITDVLGALLLLAPTRSLVRRAIERNLQSRVVQRAARFSRGPSPSYDVDATARDTDQTQLHG
ncbi:MAG: FxsA family protein [Solirubrobacteraceae bacterium]